MPQGQNQQVQRKQRHGPVADARGIHCQYRCNQATVKAGENDQVAGRGELLATA